MNESTVQNGGFDWGQLLNTAVKAGGSILEASIDKPISNAGAPQVTNQLSPVEGSEEALIAAKSNPKGPNLTPYLIGGGLLIVGIMFIVVLKNAK